MNIVLTHLLLRSFNTKEVFFKATNESMEKDEQNKKQGVWKEFHENLEVKKEMKFNDDSLDGYVKEYDVKGNLLSTKKLE